jgi:hypothetical protein
MVASGRLGNYGSNALVGAGSGCQGYWSITNGWVTGGDYEQHLMFGTPHFGASTCIVCPAGAFSSAEASESCAGCAAGSFSSSAGSKSAFVEAEQA